MRPGTSIVIAAVSLLFFASCKDETPWAQYTSKDGGFSVFMPVNPIKSDKKIGKQTVHYVSWTPTSLALNKFKLFEVSYTDYAAGVPADTMQINTLLDTAIAQRKRDFFEGDIGSQPISLNGYRGRAFIYQPERGNTTTIVKECMVGSRRYDITVIAKKDYPTNDEINRFFNSFQILR